MYRKSASIGATQSAVKRDALEPLPLEAHSVGKARDGFRL